MFLRPSASPSASDAGQAGAPRAAVFTTLRSLGSAGAEGELHATAVVVDERAAFVPSTNLTVAAFDRNIQVGVLAQPRPAPPAS
jgi:phosphatidylserine/phosphatidylglycerophosphate/cardiolipin synthase-like enzyme